MKVHRNRDPAEELQEMVDIAVREHGPQARSVQLLARALEEVRRTAPAAGAAAREVRSPPRERRERPVGERVRRD